jgi:hypothetical protein
MVSQATIVGSSFRTACKIRETDSTALTQLRETPPLNHSVGGVERPVRPDLVVLFAEPHSK